MIGANEVAPGIWMFYGAPEELGWGVIVGEGRAAVIDPPSSPVGLDATERFVEEAHCVIEAAVYTYNPQEGVPNQGRWPSATLLTPAMFEERTALPVGVSGWEAVPLYKREQGARMGAYNVWERVLFCGDMLADMVKGEGIPVLKEGSRSYLDSLKVVKGLDVKFIAPRRGTLAQGKRAISGRIENDTSYVYDMRSRVISAIMSEVSLERVLEVSLSVYGDFAFLEEHLENIRRVWDELAEKEDAVQE